VNQVAVTIHTFFFIARPWIKNRLMRQHRTSLVRNIKEISVAFQTLIILKGSIGFFTIFWMIVFGLDKVNDDVFYTVKCLLIKKVKGVVRCRKMAIHAIGDKTLGIIDMGGGFPGVVSILNFMAGCAKLGSGSPHHRIVPDAE